MSDTDPLAQPPPPGLDAYALADLAQRALDAADHWATLNDYDRVIQCHIMAATYFIARSQAWRNFQPSVPAPPIARRPLWMAPTYVGDLEHGQEATTP